MKEIVLVDSNSNYKGLILIAVTDNKLQETIIRIILTILEELGCKIRIH